MEKIPESFICPVTFDLLKDPVILGTTGHTFERAFIVHWLTEHNVDPLTNSPLDVTTLTPNFALRDAINDYVRRVSGIIIPPSELILGERIGAGSEKEAFKATYKDQPVVVLRLRQSAGTNEEAQLFVRLGCHPHLVRFIGRTKIGDVDAAPNALVTELAVHGDLASYLGHLSDAGQELSLKHRLLLGEQVADGMVAVHAAGIIHRDLAARNICPPSLSCEGCGQTKAMCGHWELSCGKYFLTATFRSVLLLRMKMWALECASGLILCD